MSVALPSITGVRLTPILIADPPLLNLSGVHQPYTPRLIVEVLTSAGVIGLGETYGDAVYLERAAALSRELIGMSIGAVNAVAGLGRGADALLNDAPAASGLRGVLTTDKVRSSVVSAFEVAVFDALGRHLGVPVHTLLGGAVRDRVEYSGYLFYKWAEHPVEGASSDDWDAALDPAGIVAQARKFLAYGGFRSFKLKGGVLPPEQEIAAIRALAAEFPGAPLRLDPNGGWSMRTALQVAEELAGTIEYLEDPTAGLDDLAELHRRTAIPLATNMIVTCFDEIRPAFDRDAVQIVLSDHHFWGGLLATRDLAAICRTYGRGLSIHSNTHLGISLAAMTQVAATVPDLDYACDTHYPWQSEDVLTERFRFTDGCVAVPDAPGLGVDLDRAAMARLHERWKALPEYRNRDDVAAMRRADPAYRAPAAPKF
ncbi:glucarate dehydratase family protein [Nocardia sp. NPDC051570]|uniref:glucarate dehydratase family protein n=1 Tax=Nocardia sp. NPDC051570 TaxID=3364324 RepID=UPI003795647B